MGTELRIRRAARALVVDDQDRVLLVRFAFPDDGPHEPLTIVWAVPGGGRDEGESVSAAIKRELYEELGLSVTEIGPHLWSRRHLFPFLNGRYDGQLDVVHLVRVEHFEPQPAIGWEQLRAEYVTELRWWTQAEIARARNLTFAPIQLAAIVADLTTHGPPPVALDVD
jgi:8-oxo-dGTP diphosphatase